MPLKYEEALKYNRERYHWFKQHHFCTNCSKQDAFTLNGRTLCFECREKKKIQKSQKNKDVQQARDKDKYEKLKSAGICVQCKSRKANPGKVRCPVCTAYISNYYYKTRQPTFRDYDKCYRCGNQLDGQLNADGSRSKVCKSCYSRLHDSLQVAWENRV